MRFTRRRLDSSGGDATQAAEVAIHRTVAEGCIGGGGFLVFVRFLSLSLFVRVLSRFGGRRWMVALVVDGCWSWRSLSLYVGGRDGVGVGDGWEVKK